MLPPWAHDLAALLRASAGQPGLDDLALARSITVGGSLPMGDGQHVPIREGFADRALASFLPALRERLRTHGRPSRGLEDGLTAAFLRQVLLFSLPSLRALADDAFPPTRSPLDGWAAALDRSPALARVIGVLFSQWAGSAGELLERLTADGPELRILLDHPSWAGAPVPIGSSSSAGDRHNGGRYVTEIEFEGGGRVYYKPKDLRLGDALAALVERLDLDLVLPGRVSRTDYLFEETIRESKPSSPVGWRKLARQLGMWIRLLSVLGASDLLKGNVLVAGDELVPVDTETIVPFLFVPADELPWQPAGARLGLLTAPLVTRNEAPAEDFGLFADGSNAPILDHVDAIVEGFCAMHRRLVERRTELSRQLESWAALPARAILRNTWVYMRLLLDSLDPQALADGVERDLVLERLWRAHFRFGVAESLVEAEVAALRDLDVPMFQFPVGGRDLIRPGDRRVPAALHDPPLAGVRDRLRALTPEPDQADLDGLRTLAFCGSPCHRADLNGSDGFARTEAAASTIRWADEAARVARELLEFLRCGGPGGGRLDSGLTYLAHNGVFVLPERRSPDILSGTAGIAIVLAELGRLAGRFPDDGDKRALGEGLAAEAAALAAEVRRQSRNVLDDVERWLDSGKDPPLCGLYWGLPAWIHVLCALPTDEGRREAEDTVPLLAAIDPDRAWPEGRLVPAAGLLLAAEALAESRQPTGSFGGALREVRDRLSDYLVEHWERSWPCTSVNAVLAGTLPSAHGSAGLALWRHSRNVGHELPASVAAWRDRCSVDSEGDRLVLLAMGVPVIPPPVPDTSLGLLNAVEAAVVEHRVQGSPEATGRAVELGKTLLARRQRFGRWFPEGHAADRFRLSAIWGMGAIALAFRSLADPRTAWSLRLLEPPSSGEDET